MMVKIVNRKYRPQYCHAFYQDMWKYTEGQWPKAGSLDSCKIQLIQPVLDGGGCNLLAGILFICGSVSEYWAQADGAPLGCPLPTVPVKARTKKIHLEIEFEASPQAALPQQRPPPCTAEGGAAGDPAPFPPSTAGEDCNLMMQRGTSMQQAPARLLQAADMKHDCKLSLNWSLVNPVSTMLSDS